MRHAVEQAEITLYITTEQNVSNFTIETKFSGLIGFNETSSDSGLYSHTGTAQRGEFTFIQLQAIDGLPGLSVQSDGNNTASDRQKGLILTADNPKHELTVYALYSSDGISSDFGSSTDTFMAINCVNFPTARNYQYFIFTVYINGGGGSSQFLMTPCQDNTTIRVRPSQPYTHPSWVNSSVQRTTPGTLSEEEAIYGRRFNRFDTLLFSNDGDLTGTIITSDKPLSVFSGYSDFSFFLVEQIPPHPTYGNLFFLSSIFNRVIFQIGSVSDEASIQVNCPCRPNSVSNSRLRISLTGSGRFFTAVMNQGQYVECSLFSNPTTACSIQSIRPVTVMSYQLINSFSMVYIPPVDSYLTQYSLTSLGDSSVSLSYSLQDLNFPGLLVNGSIFPPSDGFTTIDCRSDCSKSIVCGRGATGRLGRQGTFDIQFSGDVPFWGFAGSAGEFTYSLPFEMRPIGCKFKHR